MKNYEKYEDKIREYDGYCFCSDFVMPYILKSEKCNGRNCDACQVLQTIWLLKEYEEPETDWSKVEVDTPILVANFETNGWSKRYFAKYEDGRVYAWSDGKTSWSTSTVTRWKYAKLAESEEE